MQFIQEDPVHPVDILTEDFMAEFGVSLVRMADDIGVPMAKLEAVVSRQASVDADLALRLGRYFGTSPEFWMNLQGSYDLALALKSAGDLQSIRPVNAA